MQSRENVPAPEGHVCNETRADDAAISRALRQARMLRAELESVHSRIRQHQLRRRVSELLDLPYPADEDRGEF